MPGYFNRIILVGNLTRDPEQRFLQSGSAMTKFGLAVTRKRKSGDETLFVDIVAFEKLAEICNTYLKKGENVLVEGRLAIRSYENKDGQKRYATEVVIDEMQMLGKKGGRESDPRDEPASAVPGMFDEIPEGDAPF